VPGDRELAPPPVHPLPGYPLGWGGEMTFQPREVVQVLPDEQQRQRRSHGLSIYGDSALNRDEGAAMCLGVQTVRRGDGPTGAQRVR